MRRGWHVVGNQRALEARRVVWEGREQAGGGEAQAGQKCLDFCERS